MKPLVRFLLSVVAYLAFAALLGALLLEALVGCGQTYVDAKGERHQYECLFIPQPAETK